MVTLLQLINEKRFNEANEFVRNQQIQTLFNNACFNGDLLVAQWLISDEMEASHGKIDLHANDEGAFRSACHKGNLLLAQWLISLGKDEMEASHGKINIHAKNDYAFIIACNYGHLLVIQWLTSLEASHGKINIHAYECAFRVGCYNGRILVAQWFQSLCPDLYEVVIENNNIVSYNVIKRLKKIVNPDVSLIYTECSICQELQSDCSTPVLLYLYQ
jgi:hypothetical protein